MRIEWFKAKGFRSLRDVEIDGFGPFNVFYGPNGAGKSNLLAAMQVFFALLETHIHKPDAFTESGTYVHDQSRIIAHRDHCQLDRSSSIVLGARLCWSENAAFPRSKPPGLTCLTIEVIYSWPNVRVSRLEGDGIDLIAMQLVQQTNIRGFVLEVARSAFTLIDADRVPRYEQTSKEHTTIEDLLATGALKEALLRASKHPNAGIRKRYKQLGALLEGPPFHRPPFEMTEDPHNNVIELVETVGDPPRDIPLDLVGLGLAQVYYILAGALLGNTRIAAIEEPEAHLHAPTTGMQLRQVLERLVNEGYLDQLFIATHSNLFDLDPGGYFDVSFDPERGTQVTRKSLDEIDKHHLYEPGPAKHILQHFLGYMDENAVVFRRPDGTPVTIREMLDLLQRDDPLAKEFLDDVHGAAVRAVRVKHKAPTTENAG